LGAIDVSNVSVVDSDIGSLLFMNVFSLKGVYHTHVTEYVPSVFVWDEFLKKY